MSSLALQIQRRIYNRV